MIKDLNIITFDTETSHSVLAEFGLRRHGMTSHDNILQDWFMFCAAWKTLGQKKVHSVSLLDDPKAFDQDITNDRVVVEKLHEVLSSADMLVGHNIDNFDWKVFNTRCIYHGLPPVPKIRTADTYKIARRAFRFTSNRLDYIAKFLGVGAKVETEKGLWLKALAGDKKALKAMTKYCCGDVQVNEDVYLKLRPFDHMHPNLSTINDMEDTTPRCTKCNSDKLQKRGYARTNAGVFHRYQCQNCTGWGRGRKNLANKSETGVAPSDKYLHSQ